MASFTNAGDVITAAIEIERRGFMFYTSAASSAAIPEDRDFFTFMAKEEKRHEGLFQAMLGRVGGLNLPAGSSEAEYLEYVDLLLNTHCLFLQDQMAATQRDPLHQAITFEKDTIIFFTAMRPLVSPAEQPHVDVCIEEEQRHLCLIAEHAKAKRMGMTP